jgi:hypothetical protein
MSVGIYVGSEDMDINIANGNWVRLQHYFIGLNMGYSGILEEPELFLLRDRLFLALNRISDDPKLDNGILDEVEESLTLCGVRPGYFKDCCERLLKAVDHAINCQQRLRWC